MTEDYGSTMALKLTFVPLLGYRLCLDEIFCLCLIDQLWNHATIVFIKMFGILHISISYLVFVECADLREITVTIRSFPDQWPAFHQRKPPAPAPARSRVSSVVTIAGALTSASRRAVAVAVAVAFRAGGSKLQASSSITSSPRLVAVNFLFSAPVIEGKDMESESCNCSFSCRRFKTSSFKLDNVISSSGGC
ncbi:hypothetical protein CMV_029849 [Castanea mollissima]|uniref:Uncharacterized protein n=1 Tax=Castanea mollissima TaxID=60419 RepID=A0A8J4Q4E3_9ROSI|nr:hypothetical protein CMV_029849 [Castanea mollissima]